MKTGITPPVQSSANPTESDIWAVFDDDGSDGGIDEEEGESMLPDDGVGLRRAVSTADRHRASPHYDHHAAAKAVLSVDDPSSPTSRRGRQSSGGSLEPPRFNWAEAPWRRKKTRGWSAGSRSVRTSSSSSANRTALTGLLETMGISSIGSASSGATTAVSGSGLLPLSKSSAGSGHGEINLADAPPPPPPNQPKAKETTPSMQDQVTVPPPDDAL